MDNDHPVFNRLAQRCAPHYEPVIDRVLMLTSGFVRGGAERRMVATASGLVQRGYDVRLVAMRAAVQGEIDLQPDIASLGLDAHIAPAEALADGGKFDVAVEAELARAELEVPIWWFAGVARPFARAILEFRPQVVHGWIDRFAIVAGLVSSYLGTPRIVIGQTNTTPENRRYPEAELLRQGYRALARHPAVSLVNVSLRCAAEHEDWLGLERGRISTLYTGLLPGMIRTSSADQVAAYRKKLGIPRDARVVGTVMRFEEPKDPDLWLETAREIARMRPGVYFLIAGDGSLKAAMLERIAALDLRAVTVLPGPSHDVSLTYAAMDVFLTTSRVEGLSNALVEAQAAGRPIVSTDVGGNPEAVVEHVTGLVVRERSPTNLAEAVVSILDDPRWKARVAVQGPRFAAEQFGYDRMIAETIELYGSRR